MLDEYYSNIIFVYKTCKILKDYETALFSPEILYTQKKITKLYTLDVLNVKASFYILNLHFRRFIFFSEPVM